MSEAFVGTTVAATLAHHLGPNVTRMAMKSFAKKAGLDAPEHMTPTHIPALIDEILPMLKVMIGSEPADAVVTQIQAVSR